MSLWTPGADESIILKCILKKWGEKLSPLLVRYGTSVKIINKR